uniref:Uncharacterized protein n=1 Tax=Rhizophagus irregularis (strain DAOM 181602 / DAOM 197198 / MUCL 43194) TaxID=747089 RepID=U9TAY2_RHIID
MKILEYFTKYTTVIIYSTNIIVIVAVFVKAFGVKLRRDVLHANNVPSGDNQDIGLIAFFNSQPLDHQDDNSEKQKSAGIICNLKKL